VNGENKQITMAEYLEAKEFNKTAEVDQMKKPAYWALGAF
jgi:hypothetical protein